MMELNFKNSLSLAEAKVTHISRVAVILSQHAISTSRKAENLPMKEVIKIPAPRHLNSPISVLQSHPHPVGGSVIQFDFWIVLSVELTQ